MKKLIPIFVVVLFFILTACNSQQSNSKITTIANETTNNIVDTADNTDKFSDMVNKLPSDKYGTILASGDGYYLVKKEEETYNSATTKYGVVDENGNWVCPLSDKNGFAKSVEEIMEDPYNQSYCPARFDYLNEGFFWVETFCVLAENESKDYDSVHADSRIVRYDGKVIGNGGYMMTKFYDGYCFSSDSLGNVVRIDTQGNRTDVANRRGNNQAKYVLDSMYKLAVPSCGLIFCGEAFYSVKTCEKAIDLSEYSLTLETLENPRFSADGTFTFYFNNPNKTKYVATIDTSGNFVQEPTKC